MKSRFNSDSDLWSAALESSHAAIDAANVALGAAWDADDIHATHPVTLARVYDNEFSTAAADAWTAAANAAIAAAAAYRAVSA